MFVMKVCRNILDEMFTSSNIKVKPDESLLEFFPSKCQSKLSLKPLLYPKRLSNCHLLLAAYMNRNKDGIAYI